MPPLYIVTVCQVWAPCVRKNNKADGTFNKSVAQQSPFSSAKTASYFYFDKPVCSTEHKPKTYLVNPNLFVIEQLFSINLVLPRVYKVKNYFHDDAKTWFAFASGWHLQIKWHVASSVQFSHSVMSNSLWPHGLQHARLPCASPIPEVCSNSCPSSQWCHLTISSFVIPFPSHPGSFLASGSFPMTHQIANLMVSNCWSHSHQMAKELELQPQYQSFQQIFRTDFL